MEMAPRDQFRVTRRSCQIDTGPKRIHELTSLAIVVLGHFSPHILGKFDIWRKEEGGDSSSEPETRGRSVSTNWQGLRNAAWNTYRRTTLLV